MNRRAEVKLQIYSQVENLVMQRIVNQAGVLSKAVKQTGYRVWGRVGDQIWLQFANEVWGQVREQASEDTDESKRRG